LPRLKVCTPASCPSPYSVLMAPVCIRTSLYSRAQ